MNLIVLVPHVIRSFVANFPEVTNNAYKYFNFDRRVYEERVPRGDPRIPYRSPGTLRDADYGSLILCAKNCINPILAKYSMTVACEDALHSAIRSFGNGRYDNKINASKFISLLGELKKSFGIEPGYVENYRHAKKTEKDKKTEKAEKPQDVEVRQHVLKQLGLSPTKVPSSRYNRNVPFLLRDDKGKIRVKKDK